MDDIKTLSANPTENELESLVEKAQMGSISGLNALIIYFLPMAQKLVDKRIGNVLPRLEKMKEPEIEKLLIQGRLLSILEKSILSYESRKGKKLSTYVTKYVEVKTFRLLPIQLQREVINHFRKYTNPIEEPDEAVHKNDGIEESKQSNANGPEGTTGS